VGLGQASGRRSRIIASLAHTPAEAFVSIIGLLLFALPFERIDEQLCYRQWCLNDFTLMRIYDHIAVRAWSVLGFVGMVERYAANPNCGEMRR